MMQTSTQNIIPETISPEAQKILQNLIEAFDPNSKYPEPTDFSDWKKLQTELDLSKSILTSHYKSIRHHTCLTLHLRRITICFLIK